MLNFKLRIIKKLFKSKIPIFGICLGHQLISLALGAKTKKMFQGHRGANHPVQNLENNKVEITSQNHGFVVTEKSIPKNIKITHKFIFKLQILLFKLNYPILVIIFICN